MKYFLVLIFLFTHYSSNSQNIKKIWDKRFGGTETDYLYSICNTEDNNFLLAGTSFSGLNGDKSQTSRGLSDSWILKIDNEGNKIWDKRFGGNDDDAISAVIKSPSNFYYLAGSSESGISGDKSQSNRGDSDFWVVKIDKNGNKIWDKRFGSSLTDYITTIIQTDDNGFLLCGNSDSNVGGDKTQNSRGFFDFWVVKIDSNGTKLWDKTYGGNNYDYLDCAIKTQDNSIILCGSSASGINGEKTESHLGYGDFWMIKITTNGNIIWDKRYGTTDTDYANSLIELSNGNLVICGTTYLGTNSIPGYTPVDYLIVQTDSNGNKIWDKIYGTVLFDELRSSILTTDGGFLLGGYNEPPLENSNPISYGYEDFFLMKLDTFGNLKWSRNFGGIDFEDLRIIHKVNDNSYLLVGSSTSPISGDKTQNKWGGYDFWVIKVQDCYAPNLNISGNSSESIYQAGENLISNQNINNNLEYFAGNSIMFLPNFKTQIGITFKAEIKKGCNN